MSKALSDPPSQNWRRISPRLNAVEQISGAVGWGVLLVLASVPLALRALGVWPGYPAWVAWSVPALAVVGLIINAVIIPFQVRNRRYALREDDVAVARGVVWHRVEVIPYGRIQYVDVVAGPLLRAFGLCTLQVHTASPDAHPEIAGLTAQQGAELRDELARRGEERLAGL